jgi:hypothetical protein
MVTASADAIEVEREPGREPLPRLVLRAGGEALWDGRFRVGVSKDLIGEFEVRVLEAQGLAELRSRGACLEPRRRVRLAPSFWSGGELRAVPCVHFWQEASLQEFLYSEFTGLRYNSSAVQPGP